MLFDTLIALSKAISTASFLSSKVLASFALSRLIPRISPSCTWLICEALYSILVSPFVYGRVWEERCYYTILSEMSTKMLKLANVSGISS